MAKKAAVMGWMMGLLAFPLLWAQSTEIITVIDTTQVKIGEAIGLTVQVKATPEQMVEFPPAPLFAPLELLEEFPVDTLRASAHYLLTKRYALIQFDSGAYRIPRQKIMVDGQLFYTDSLALEVATVAVDTLKQPLFDIKPIQVVAKDYRALYRQIGGFLLVIVLLIALYFLTRQYQKKKAQLQEELPPYERALQTLKALEAFHPTVQQEYKDYYSTLTDVVRRYLEEEASIDALESTTDELMEKLNLRKDAGTLALQRETLANLRKVLQQADLVKFARSAPSIAALVNDRQMVEQVVVETQEALPEPTQEELEATAAYQREIARRRRIQKLQLGGLGTLVVLVFVAIGAISYYGFTPVKDTLFRYPTKVLLDGTWVKSMYGAPPIVVETPEVLYRDPASNQQKLIYATGNPLEGVYVQMYFEKRDPKKKSETAEESEAAARQLLDEAIARYEASGATNLLVQNDTFTTAEGTEAIRLFGSLEVGDDNQKERCRFVSILFPFEQATVELKIIYAKEDRYGPVIEERLLNSIQLIKEL